MECIRHGDLLFVRTNKKNVVGAKTKRDNGRLILAYGEVTGHAHAIKDKEGVDLIKDSSGKEFLSVQKKDGADLHHEEHATVHFDKGVWEMKRQREYSPEEIRRVLD